MKTTISSAIVLVLLVALFAVTVEARTFPGYPGLVAVNARAYADCIKACNGVFSAESAGCVGLGSQFRAANAPRTYTTASRCKSDAARKMQTCKRDCKTKK